MSVPIILAREGLIDAVVEVFVVGEDNVAADVVKLGRLVVWCSERGASRGARTKPSGVTSVEARPPGISLLSIIIHEGPFCEPVSNLAPTLPSQG